MELSNGQMRYEQAVPENGVKPNSAAEVIACCQVPLIHALARCKRS